MPVNGIFDVFDMLSIYIIYKLIVSNNTWPSKISRNKDLGAPSIAAMLSHARFKAAGHGSVDTAAALVK